MSGVNKVIIVGRLGQDPESKTLTGGQTVTRMSVATSENWTDKQGQKQEKTEWHKVTAWGKLAEVCSKHLSKGRQVYLEGKLQTDTWEKDGVKHYSTGIVASTVQFLGSAPGATSGPQDYGVSEPQFDQKEDIPF